MTRKSQTARTIDAQDSGLKKKGSLKAKFCMAALKVFILYSAVHNWFPEQTDNVLNNAWSSLTQKFNKGAESVEDASPVYKAIPVYQAIPYNRDTQPYSVSTPEQLAREEPFFIGPPQTSLDYNNQRLTMIEQPQEVYPFNDYQNMRNQHKELLQDPRYRTLWNQWLSQFSPTIQANRNATVSDARKALAREVDRVVDERITYVRDIDNHGVEDKFWPPVKTLEDGRGDCEDFAFLKNFTLEDLGVNPKRIFTLIVPLVQDTNGNVIQECHATTVVDLATLTPHHHDFLIYDNDGVEKARPKSTYPSYILMNEDNMWSRGSIRRTVGQNTRRLANN